MGLSVRRSASTERLRNEEPFCRACADLRRSADVSHFVASIARAEDRAALSLIGHHHVSAALKIIRARTSIARDRASVTMTAAGTRGRRKTTASRGRREAAGRPSSAPGRAGPRDGPRLRIGGPRKSLPGNLEELRDTTGDTKKLPHSLG
jgi:hypothetical protein